jgi:lipopolysaccharide/colanic/teichoic acid biosynthesis glycosyltransferase
MMAKSTEGGKNILGHPHWALAAKRILDVLLSFVALLLLTPVITVVAVLVNCNSPGPIFYRGVRAGLNGSPFLIYKFRTMVNGAETLGGPTTGTNDPRVTRIGRVLRRYKLDELPQFINVLKGDMSLVGPRPEVLEYTSQYTGEERLILKMRPGITDHASLQFVNLDDIVGRDAPNAFFREHILPEKNALRLRYVKQWTLLGDFVILFRTILKVMQKAIPA